MKFRNVEIMACKVRSRFVLARWPLKFIDLVTTTTSKKKTKYCAAAKYCDLSVSNSFMTSIDRIRVINHMFSFFEL